MQGGGRRTSEVGKLSDTNTSMDSRDPVTQIKVTKLFFLKVLKV